MSQFYDAATTALGGMSILVWVMVALLSLTTLAMGVIMILESRQARLNGQPVHPARREALRRMVISTLLMWLMIPACFWVVSALLRSGQQDAQQRQVRLASMSEPLRAQVRVGGRWRTLESAPGESSCLWAALRYPALDIEVRTGEQALRPGMGVQVRLPDGGRPPQDWMAGEVFCHEYLGRGPLVRWAEARFAD